MIKSMTVDFRDGKEPLVITSDQKHYIVDGEKFQHSELVQYLSIKAMAFHPEMTRENNATRLAFVRSQMPMWSSALLLMME